VIGWCVSLLGWSDYVQPAAVGKSLEQFGLRLPIFSTDVWQGLSQVLPLLATAIPMGIYNFTEGMNNVESASAAGDDYNLRHILLADGIGAVVGSIFGSPFPPAVYIGHPGWKAVGGRIGYSLATGVFVGLICFLGLAALLLALIPLAALVPILLFIGLVIGAQAFTASPARHAPAAVLAILPNLALWAKGLVDNTLAVAGTDVKTVGLDNLAAAGVLYQGMSVFAGGAVLAGLMLGKATVLAIFLAVLLANCASKIRTVNLYFADQVNAALFARECFADFVREHERRFVLAVEIARQLQSRKALSGVHDDADGRQQVHK